jgi:hypothetical protein
MSIFDDAKRCFSTNLVEQYFACIDNNNIKSHWKRNEYWTLNPLRGDSTIGSFSINRSGYYSDFSDSDCKGDFIDLVSKHFNLSSKKAAEKIVKDTGGFVRTEEINVTQKPKKLGVKLNKEKQQKTKKLFIEYANKNFFLNDKKRDRKYKPTNSYSYQDNDGNVLFYVVRYETEDDKEKDKKFHQFYLNEKEKVKAGIPENFGKRPLYNLKEMLEKKDLPIIIVEGEKCAKVNIEGYIVATWCNGANAISKTDWSILKKREVYIWPDNDKQKYKEGHERAGEIKDLKDQPGYKCALNIKENYLKNSTILDISKLDKPAKWDLADADKENIDIVKLIEELKENISTEFAPPPIDPFYAYQQFVKDIYGENNLIQFDGVMWRYIQKEHFWQSILKENVFADFQTWSQQSGVLNFLDELEKSKSSFVNQGCGFLNKHTSSGFFTENYFKNSAVLPFINFSNGVVHLKDRNFDFYKRTDYDEEFFKKKYPMNCFEYPYREDLQGEINLENIKEHAPLFCYFVESIVPKSAKNDKNEVLKTYKFILQMIAYCMSPKKPGEHFFGFYGREGTAKTSLFRLIEEFIGKDFVCSRPTSDMVNNKFASSDLWNSKIFVDHDLAENMALPDDFIKLNSGENTVTIESKYQKPIKGVFLSITMFFISNYEFKTTGVEGIGRRAIIVKFENQVKEEKRDRRLMDRLTGKIEHDYKTPDYEGQIFDEGLRIHQKN